MKSKYTYVKISLTKETEEEGSYGDDDVTYFDGEEPLLLNDDICRDDLFGLVIIIVFLFSKRAKGCSDNH